jgi:conjugal transfer pilus assembly protein TraE
MNKNIEQHRISYLLSQRNILAGTSTVLLTTVLLQSIFLFFRNERIIISPPELHQSYWVEGDRFSESYLEEMATHFAHLLLDVSADSLLYQGEVVLRSVDASSYSRIRTKLLADVQKLKKENVTSRFEPKSAFIAKNSLEVQLKGTMTHYISGKAISAYDETFVIRFSAHKGKIYIKDFSLLDTKNKNFNDDVEKKSDKPTA